MLKFNTKFNPPPYKKRPAETEAGQPKPRVKLLCWSDWTEVTTGFGIVSRYILRALHNTGRYEITQLAINMVAKEYDAPYKFIPAKLQNPEDVYGNQTMAELLVKGDYDVALIINDLYVTQELSDHLDKIMEMRRSQGKKAIKIVYYYPVDCCVNHQGSGLLRRADYSVAYTHFGVVETKKVVPSKPDRFIYHGVDTTKYRPLSPEIKLQARQRVFNLDDPNTFVWLNVNRNTPRKNMALCCMAFKEFQKQVPNSKMYLHTPLVDKSRNHMPLDLRVVVDQLQLDFSRDIIVPLHYSPSQGLPAEQLNLIYNAADALITTTYGEGWGLSLSEALAAGLPVVGPDNTSITEILAGGERGYLYPCKERVFIDNTGIRPLGRLEDILQEMMKCYTHWKTKSQEQREMIHSGLLFAQLTDWDEIGQQWVDVIDEVASRVESTQTRVEDI